MAVYLKPPGPIKICGADLEILKKYKRPLPYGATFAYMSKTFTAALRHLDFTGFRKFFFYRYPLTVTQCPLVGPKPIRLTVHEIKILGGRFGAKEKSWRRFQIFPRCP
uniref:Uncharacterized protein n=1 Tax=Meloidogyne enterolobii TaxID=390850 RepID=A0A6V7VNE7_MELEN|nr:unnamed protein product [Meloidogyne enterolobii]